VCAALLPHVIAANIAAMRRAGDGRGLARYADVGRRLAGEMGLADEPAIEACVRITSGFVRELKIPALSAFGMSRGDVPEMVGLARKASSMRFNPVVLSDDALSGALSAAIG
jgi:alcohol dehydrogenase class IV